MRTQEMVTAETRERMGLASKSGVFIATPHVIGPALGAVETFLSFGAESADEREGRGKEGRRERKKVGRREGGEERKREGGKERKRKVGKERRRKSGKEGIEKEEGRRKGGKVRRRAKEREKEERHQELNPLTNACRFFLS